MSGFLDKLKDLGYDKPKHAVAKIPDVVSNAVSDGLHGAAGIAEEAIHDPSDAIQKVIRAQKYSPQALPFMILNEAIDRSPFAPYIPNLPSSPMDVVRRGQEMSLDTLGPIARDIATNPLDRIAGIPGQGQDLLRGVGSAGPLTKDWMHNVSSSVGDFRADPSLMGSIKVIGSVLSGIGIPLDTMKENTGHSLYTQAKTGKKGDFGATLDLIMASVPGGADASPSQFLEQNPDLAQEVVIAYEQGYNGFTGPRAAWEYVVGKMSKKNRIMTDILYDPTTYLAGGGAAAKAIKGGRTAEELSLARRGAALPFELLGGVDTAQNKVIEAPFKAIGKLDTLVGSPLAKGGSAIANSPVADALGRGVNWLTSPPERVLKQQFRDETIAPTIDKFAEGVSEVDRKLTDRINQISQQRGMTLAKFMDQKARLEKWRTTTWAKWQRKAIDAIESGQPIPPMPKIPKAEGFEIDTADLNRIVQQMERMGPTTPGRARIKNGLGPVSQYTEPEHLAPARRVLEKIERAESFENQLERLRGGEFAPPPELVPDPVSRETPTPEQKTPAPSEYVPVNARPESVMFSDANISSAPDIPRNPEHGLTRHEAALEDAKTLLFRLRARAKRLMAEGKEVPEDLVKMGRNAKQEVVRLSQIDAGTPLTDAARQGRRVPAATESQRQLNAQEKWFKANQFPEYTTDDLRKLVKKDRKNVAAGRELRRRTEKLGIPQKEFEYRYYFNHPEARKKFQRRYLELKNDLGYKDDLIEAGETTAGIDEETGRNYLAPNEAGYEINALSGEKGPWAEHDLMPERSSRDWLEDDPNMGNFNESSNIDTYGRLDSSGDEYLGGRRRLEIETRMEPGGEFAWDATRRQRAEQYFDRIREKGSGKVPPGITKSEAAEIAELARDYPDSSSLEDALSRHISGAPAVTAEGTLTREQIAKAVQASPDPPPIREGYTRLYRGTSMGEIEARQRNLATPLSELGPMHQQRRIRGIEQASGRWFATNPGEISPYMDPAVFGAGSQNVVTYVDVPTRDLRKYLVEGQGASKEAVDLGEGKTIFVDVDPGRHSLRPDLEYFLPRDIADSSQVFPMESWPPFEGPDPSQLPPNLGPLESEYAPRGLVGPDAPASSRYRIGDIYDGLTERQKQSVKDYYLKKVKALRDGTKDPSRVRVLPNRFHHNFLDDIDRMANDAASETSRILSAAGADDYDTGLARVKDYIDRADAQKAKFDDFDQKMADFYARADEIAKKRGSVGASSDVIKMLPRDPVTGERIVPDWKWINRRATPMQPKINASTEALKHQQFDELASRQPLSRPNQDFMQRRSNVAHDDFAGWSVEEAIDSDVAVSQFARMYPEQWPIVKMRMRARAGEFEEFYNGVKDYDRAIMDAQFAEMFIEEAANVGIDARFLWTERQGNMLTGVEYKPGTSSAMIEEVLHSANLEDVTEQLGRLRKGGIIFPFGENPVTQAQVDAQKRFAEIVRLQKRMTMVPRLGPEVSLNPIEPRLKRTMLPGKRRSVWTVLDENGAPKKDADGKVLEFFRKTDAMREAYGGIEQGEKELREQVIEKASGIPRPVQKGPKAKLSGSPDGQAIDKALRDQVGTESVTVEPLELRNADHIAKGEELETNVDLDRYLDELIPDSTTNAQVRRLLGGMPDTKGMSKAEVFMQDPAGGPHVIAEYLYKTGRIDAKQAAQFYIPDVAMVGDQSMDVSEVLQWAWTKAAGDRQEYNRLAYGILGKQAPIEKPGKLIKAWDTYLNVVREMMLMNFTRGLAALFTDNLSNIYMQALKGDFDSAKASANILEYINNAEFAMNPKNGYEHSVIGWAESKFGRKPPTNMVMATNRDLISGGQENTTIVKLIDSVSDKIGLAKDSKIRRAAELASTPFASRRIKALRGAQDQNARLSSWWQHMLEQDPVEKEKFYELLGKRGKNMGVDDAQIEKWKNALGDNFTPPDVKRVTGDTSLAQAWLGQINRMSKNAEKEVHKVLFSYEMTRMDDAMRHLFLFHYWQTRAIAWHANMTIRNPALLSAYFKAWEATDRSMANAGLDDDGQSFWALVLNDSWRVLLDPMALIVPFSMLREWGDKGPESNFDKIMRQSGFFLNPIIQAAATSIGLSSKNVDMTGSITTRNLIRTWIDLARDRGIIDPGVTGDPIQRAQDAVIGFINDFSVEHGPFKAKLPDVDWSKTSAYDDINEILMHQAEEEFGPWGEMTWEERQQVVAAQKALLMEEYDNPRLMSAMHEYWKAAGIEKNVRSFVPGNPNLVYQPEIGRSMLANEGYETGESTPEIESAISSTQQMNAGSPMSADLTNSNDFYVNIGDKEARDNYATYNNITYGNVPAGTFVVVNGHRIPAEEINALDDGDRSYLAEQWRQDMPERDHDITMIRDQRREFKSGNSGQDAFVRYQSAVRDKDPDRVRAEFRQYYPEFARREKVQADRLRSRGMNDAEINDYLNTRWLTSIDAYTALYGVQNKMRDPEPLPAKPYPMIPGGGDFEFGPSSSYSSYESGVPQASGGQSSAAQSLSKQISDYLNGYGPITPAVQRYLNWAGRLRALGYNGDTSVDGYLKAHADVSTLIAS